MPAEPPAFHMTEMGPRRGYNASPLTGRRLLEGLTCACHGGPDYALSTRHERPAADPASRDVKLLSECEKSSALSDLADNGTMLDRHSQAKKTPAEARAFPVGECIMRWSAGGRS